MNECNHENQAIDKYEQLIAAAITLLYEKVEMHIIVFSVH